MHGFQSNISITLMNLFKKKTKMKRELLHRCSSEGIFKKNNTARNVPTDSWNFQISRHRSWTGLSMNLSFLLWHHPARLTKTIHDIWCLWTHVGPYRQQGRSVTNFQAPHMEALIPGGEVGSATAISALWCQNVNFSLGQLDSPIHAQDVGLYLSSVWRCWESTAASSWVPKWEDDPNGHVRYRKGMLCIFLFLQFQKT